jgi:DNA polymerase I-like protein with 3'-5' exonuclease and polymerase domains
MHPHPPTRAGLAVGLDLETDKLETHRGPSVVAVGVWREDNTHWEVDLRGASGPEREGVFAALRTELAACSRAFAHNAAFDYAHLLNHGVDAAAKIRCTMVLLILLDNHRRGYSLASAAALVGEHKVEVEGAMHETTRDLILERVSSDARICGRLGLYLLGLLPERSRPVWEAESAALPVLARMQRRGVRVNAEEAKTRLSLVRRRLLSAYQEIKTVSQYPALDPLKPQTVAAFLGVKRDGDWWVDRWGARLERTALSDGPPTGRAALAHCKHPVAALVSAARELDDQRQFFAQHILGHQENGRVYPSINQNYNGEDGTKTGRLSYTKPALQQIPGRGPEAAFVRELFLPDRGRWLTADLAQFEFRVFASITRSPPLIQAYKENPTADFHGEVARLMGIPRKPPPGGGANAKQLNLGLVFCMGAGRLAMQLGLPVRVERDEGSAKGVRITPGREIHDVLRRYYAAVPGVRESLQAYKEEAEREGCVYSLLGRRLSFPYRAQSYKAAGLVYQASSADLNKWMLAEFDRRAPDRLLISVHDEFGIDADENEIDELSALLRQVSDDAAREFLHVPLAWDTNAAANWAAASLED